MKKHYYPEKANHNSKKADYGFMCFIDTFKITVRIQFVSVFIFTKFQFNSHPLFLPNFFHPFRDGKGEEYVLPSVHGRCFLP